MGLSRRRPAHCSLGPQPAHPCLQPQLHTHHLEADSSPVLGGRELIVLMGELSRQGEAALAEHLLPLASEELWL